MKKIIRALLYFALYCLLEVLLFKVIEKVFTQEIVDSHPILYICTFFAALIIPIVCFLKQEKAIKLKNKQGNEQRKAQKYEFEVDYKGKQWKYDVELVDNDPRIFKNTNNENAEKDITKSDLVKATINAYNKEFKARKHPADLYECYANIIPLLNYLIEHEGNNDDFVRRIDELKRVYQERLVEYFEEERESFIELNKKDNRRVMVDYFKNQYLPSYRNLIKYEANEETIDYAKKAVKDVGKRIGYIFKNNELALLYDNAENRNESGFKDFDDMNGTEFEEYCSFLLEKNGFNRVSLTKATGDQGVDIIAYKDNVKYAIQCKCYNNDLSNTPVQEVSAGLKLYNCDVGAVLTNRYFTKSAEELARANRIRLWDRDTLMTLIKNAEKED